MARPNILLIVLSCSLTIGAAAQNSEKSLSAAKSAAANAVENVATQRRKQALSLVEQTASQAAKWDDKTAAVRVLTDAADLFWDEDAPTARRWLLKAWDLTDAIEEQPNDEKTRQFWRGGKRSGLKNVVLQVAVRRDSKFADKLLEKLNDEADDEKRGAFDDRTRKSEQLLQLAIFSIKDNPQLAAQFAEQSLADGVSFNFLTVLVLLKQRDETAANRLFDRAAARIANNPNAQLSELQILQSYLFQPGAVFANDADGNRILAVVAGQNPNAAPAVDATRARNFLTVAHRILFGFPPPAGENVDTATARDFVLLANTLAPKFQTYAPDLAESVAVRAALFAARLPLVESASNKTATTEQTESTKKLTPEERLQKYLDDLEAKADAESDPTAKITAYAELAVKTRAEDFEKAQRIAKKIEDEKLREQVLKFVLYRASLKFLEKGDIEKAVELAEKTPQSLNKAVAQIAIAQNLIDAKPTAKEEKFAVDLRRQQALYLLFAAEKSINREETSADAAKVALGRVSVLSQLDKFQALSALSETFVLINKLDKFDVYDASTPRIGLNGFATSQLSVPRVLNGYGLRNAIKSLADEHFQNVIDGINNLRSPSIRGAAKLETAKIVLAAHPKTAKAVAQIGSTQ